MVAESLIEKGARNGQLYLEGAYAVGRARSLPEAHVLLLRGEPLLQNSAPFHYNLARYECWMGKPARIGADGRGSL